MYCNNPFHVCLIEAARKRSCLHWGKSHYLGSTAWVVLLLRYPAACKFVTNGSSPCCRSWYDLIWAFPRLSHKLAKRMLPASNVLPGETEPSAQAIEAAAAAAIQLSEPPAAITEEASPGRSDTGSGGGVLPFSLELVSTVPAE